MRVRHGILSALKWEREVMRKQVGREIRQVQM